MTSNDLTYGIHSVQAILNTAPQRVSKVLLFKNRKDQKVQKVLSLAEQHNVKIEWGSKSELDALCEGNHQGVIAFVTPGKQFEESDLYELVENTSGSPLLLVLDGVTDPHNLGACMRTAEAAGVTAIIIPKDNSVGLNETVRKTASGAADVVPLIAVTNLVRCLKKLQDQGFWVTGLAGEADDLIYDSDFKGARIIAMGAEGKGLRRLTRENCDYLAKIPMMGTVSSLNVSVATGIVLFEAQRQRAFVVDAATSD